MKIKSYWLHSRPRPALRATPAFAGAGSPPASQEKGWGVGLSGAKAQPGLAAEARSHKKLPGHRILSRMPDTHPETIAPAPPRALVGWPLLALVYDLWPYPAPWVWWGEQTSDT